jgi:hypothetical protein
MVALTATLPLPVTKTFFAGSTVRLPSKAGVVPDVTLAAELTKPLLLSVVFHALTAWTEVANTARAVVARRIFFIQFSFIVMTLDAA